MSRPPSASANKSQRHGVINFDNYIDVILASRTKKITFQLPSVSGQCSHPCSPHVAHLDQPDYDQIFGEVNGKKYDYPSRPELDLLVINGSYDREHESMLEVNYDVPVLAGSRDPSRPISANPNASTTTQQPAPTATGRPPSAAAKPAPDGNRPASAKDRFEQEKIHHQVPKTHKLDEGAVVLLYDAAKETYVLSDAKVIELMKLHTIFIPQYRQLRKQMFGEHDILMPKIDENEEFAEEKKASNDRHVEIVIVRSYGVLGKDMINTFDKKREKVWRRFLRHHVPLWFGDEEKLAALKDAIQLDIELEEKRRQDALLPIMETDQNSTDSSTVKKKKKKKGKKGGKEKDKDGKKKPGGKDKKKGVAAEDEDDDDEEEGEAAGQLLPALHGNKPSSPAQIDRPTPANNSNSNTAAPSRSSTPKKK